MRSPRKTRKPSRKTLVRNLDRLVSRIVISRDKRCITCGATQKLTCGHLFSRVAYSTRWDLLNCHVQCLSCNFRHESDPLPYIEWFRKNHGTRALNKLHKKYVTPQQFKDWQLQELFDALKLKLV